MKRFLLGMIVASGLAMLAAAPANATNELCGHNYAMLLQGTAPTTIDATGGSGQPGWLTAAVGVGVIQFGAASGTTCSSISGELIFNQGDIQTSPAGEYFGPTDCYDSDSFLGSGLPCFDGADHFSDTSLTNPGPNGNGSQELAFTETSGWYDTELIALPIPFAFTVQANTGGAIVVGSSVPAPGAPVLTITMQKIGLNPVPTDYGVAPYLGDSVVSCSAYGANETDLVANGQDFGLAGGFESAIGAVEIFNSTQAGGSLSFNANDNLTGSAATSTPNNSDCSITLHPGTADPGYGSGAESLAASQFADGTSNSFATIDEPNSGSGCTDQNTAGAGYANAGVQWGSTDTSEYLTTVGLASATTGYVPTGGMSTCTTYAQSPAGKLTSLVTPAAETSSGPVFPSTKTAVIKLTSTTPADCLVSAALTDPTGSFAECSISLTHSSLDVPGDTLVDLGATFGVNCTCTSKAIAETDTESVTVTSSNCPVTSTANPVTFTCKN